MRAKSLQPTSLRRGILLRDGSCRRRHFTMLELLAAMAVLLVLMSFLTQFLFSAQQVWNLSNNKTRIYENARIVFDVISRDLQSAVASDESGREISFYTGSTNAGYDNAKLGFISAVGRKNSLCETELSEIQYALYTGSAPTYEDDRWWFRRSQLGDQNDTDEAASYYPNHAWDFYGDTSGAWLDTTRTVPGDQDNATDFQKVIDGVSDISVSCFHPGGMAEDDFYTHLPKAVKISVTLFDPDLEDAPQAVRDKTKRTFTKIIFLR